jgi:putative zinc finger/helix-turn-helix YgiT family protein
MADDRRCPSCGSADLAWSRRRTALPYRDRAGVEREATATIRVARCRRCGMVALPAESAEAGHAAICRDCGLLAPEDIVAARARLGFTQRDLAERTGFGIASIKRWETGRTIQNLSSDRALRAVLALDLPTARMGRANGRSAASRRRAAG